MSGLSVAPPMAEGPSRLEEARRLLLAGRPQDALPLVASEARAAPFVGAAHAVELEALLALGLRSEADHALDLAMSLPVVSADAYDALAFFARRLDRHELSNAMYCQAVKEAPTDAQLWYNLATSERTLGRLSNAAAACDRALSLDPEALPALLLRSELVQATSQANSVDELRARLTTQQTDRGRMFIAYALGKELHDLALYDEAFDAFSEGASARRRNLSYDVTDDERKLERIEQVFTAETKTTQTGRTSGRYIFIVGLPRSERL